MTGIMTPPTASTPVSKADPQSALETTFVAALEHAHRLTEMYGIQNIEVTLAWETVEELRAAIADQRTSIQSEFDRYCEANPDAPESRIYDV
ncbi:MAG: Calvin cycle protein CP12 [Thermosynechococcaceae cyanobacterium]